MAVEELDLANCKNEVERKLLVMESQTKNELTSLRSEVRELTLRMIDVRDDLDKLVTRPEFEPVKMIAFGLAGGVLISALTAVLAKVLGW